MRNGTITILLYHIPSGIALIYCIPSYLDLAPSASIGSRAVVRQHRRARRPVVDRLQEGEYSNQNELP